MGGNDYLHGIAISKLFHQDLALWRNGIAEGYYRLGIADLIYGIAWALVISAAVYNLIRMAAGSPRGAKQLILVGVSSLCLGLTPQIRGDQNNVGWLWGFYHSIYSKLYASRGTDGSGKPLPPLLADIATGASVREALKQQIQAMLVLARLKTEVAGLKSLASPVASFANSGLGKALTATLVALGVRTGPAGTAASLIAAAAQEVVRQADNFLKKLDQALNEAIENLVKVTVNLMQENALIIYATATIIIFISLFWPLLAALLSFPQTAPAFVTAVGLIPGVILALVMSGTLLLTGLAVVFRTTAGVLTDYTEEVNKATQAISAAQESLQKMLEEGAGDVIKSKEIVLKGIERLEIQKQVLEMLARQGVENPTTNVSPRVCKLKIVKGQGELFSKVEETQECISTNIDLKTMEEYLNHYEDKKSQYMTLIQAELGDPKALQLNVLERTVNGILGTMARFTIQLQIARIMGFIVGIVSAVFLIYVASLGTRLGVEFIRYRLGL